MTQTTPLVSIENVVATASVGQELDLNAIAAAIPGTDYQPDRFPGLVFRMTKPAASTLIFRTGKMVCTGTKSEGMARLAVRSVVERLRASGIIVERDAAVSIQNIVASADLGGSIHIERAARTLPRSMYEPEQFPGLIHRVPDPKTVMLLFSSGKVVCTGAKSEGDVFRAVNGLHAMLEEKGLMGYS